MNKTIISVLTAAVVASCAAVPAYAYDNGDGTFSNPVIWADMPDPDVIRVGDTFYLVTTTMHLMPGAPIMKSQDLVNWQFSSYIFDKLTDHSRYDMEDGTVYGRGQWATSIKYKDGKYYALFSPNDDPHQAYIYTTDNPDNGWTLQNRLPHFHDASLFFDDDGRAYVFYGTGNLRELEPDLTAVKEGGLETVLNVRDAEENALLEGSRVVKHDGKYYLLMISWPKDKPRRQLCYRADKIEGPYEKKVVLEDDFMGFPYVAQGTIVDDAQGNWWAVIFQDHNAVGRILTLNPVRWEDGWPVIGDNGKVMPVAQKLQAPKCCKAKEGCKKECAKAEAGCKKACAKADGCKKADKACAKAEGCCKHTCGPKGIGAVESDDFAGGKMSPLWQWNHNPLDDKWSLTERDGWLRLHASPAPHIFLARNTISQRTEGPYCEGIVRIDYSGMRNGDVAGFSIFNDEAGVMEISKKDNMAYLRLVNEKVEFNGNKKEVCKVSDEKLQVIELPATGCIDLRIVCDFSLNRDVACFSYRFDGNADWTPIGVPFKMRYNWQGFFMGSRFAVFNFTTGSEGGYIDVDSFSYRRSEDPISCQ